jgi:hypothetical protein
MTLDRDLQAVQIVEMYLLDCAGDAIRQDDAFSAQLGLSERQFLEDGKGAFLDGLFYHGLPNRVSSNLRFESYITSPVDVWCTHL